MNSPSRISNFKKLLTEIGLGGFIVTNPTNIYYLTGFKGISQSEREAILILKRILLVQGESLIRSEATLIAPRLYQNEARKAKSKDLKVKVVTERNQLFEETAKLLENCKIVGFEANNLTYSEYLRLNLKRGSTSTKILPLENLVEDLRTIKSDGEIRKIEQAQIISQKAFKQVIKTIKVGQSEEEIADKLAKIIKLLGGQGLAFESIIASGPNSGKPHHVTTDRRLLKNDILLLDFGAKFQDYCADLSRTVFIGRAKDLQINIYNHVREAQKKSIDKIVHNIKAADAFQTANNYFKKHRLNQYFLHGLGHGIGLEIHEPPYLRNQPLDTSNQLLENMVFSIEPGLYFPWGGIRIEDLVVIKQNRAPLLGQPQEQIIQIK